MKKLVSATLATSLGLALAAVAPAHAVTFGFSNITGGDVVGDALASLFTFDVTETVSGQVQFVFNNNSSGTLGSPPTITQIAFNKKVSDQSILTSLVNIGNTAGVDFKAEDKNLSQSNIITNWGSDNQSAVLGVGATPPPTSNGIGSGESLTLLYDGSYSSVISAIGNTQFGGFLGIHVQQIGTNADLSDSYVNTPGDPIDPGPPTPEEVPEPSSIIGTALFGGFGLRSYLKKRTNALKAQSAVAEA